MDRRRFIAAVTGGLLVAPVAAEAQQPVVSPRRIGFLLVGLTPESSAAQHFRDGLREAGYFEGRNVVIEWRSAKGDYDRVPEIVADFVHSTVDVIVVNSTVAAQVPLAAGARVRSEGPAPSGHDRSRSLRP